MKGRIIDDVALIMTERDTVATALTDLDDGKHIRTDEGSITLQEAIPFGHKFAIQRMEADSRVQKYGEVIGTASDTIRVGEWVHTHNCESTRGRGDVSKSAVATQSKGVDPE
ncbi:UxaA family hydrolase [Halobacteria archaeon AArc-curdl1]|uniref:UxaA family hydrolase n=1 Tax=Natronosalvus hydrolyticus TaxID=2979988 RepID=A0AAP2Z8M0_9EURY|nr:UxaA family hydrolase [Halobacteria archaeon AArc-curdl1]